MSGVPSEVLLPSNCWADSENYTQTLSHLAELFVKVRYGGGRYGAVLGGRAAVRWGARWGIGRQGRFGVAAVDSGGREGREPAAPRRDSLHAALALSRSHLPTLAPRSLLLSPLLPTNPPCSSIPRLTLPHLPPPQNFHKFEDGGGHVTAEEAHQILAAGPRVAA